MSPVVAGAVFVVAILVVSIALHELGHLLTARAFGMRADRYFIGFGPTLWSTRIGEVEVGVKALPVGGFVRIRGMSPGDVRRGPVVADVLRLVAADRDAATRRLGVTPRGFPDETWRRLLHELEDRGVPLETATATVQRARLAVGDREDVAAVTDAVERAATELLADAPKLLHRVLRGDEGRFFTDRPAWQRAVVLVAGAATHFAQAAVLLLVGFLLFGRSEALPEVAEVVPDSPAATVGLMPGDRIVAVDGAPVDDFEQLRETIRAHAGIPLRLMVERDGERVELTAVPEPVEDQGEVVGQLGFLPRVVDRPLPPGDALREAFVGETGLVSLTRLTFTALADVFGPEGLRSLVDQLAGERPRDPAGVASPIGLARVAGEGTASFGPLFLLLLLAATNVFVGTFNLIPLPPLDGGHLLVLAIESTINGLRRLRGAPADFHIDPRTITAVALPVIVLLGSVFLAALWLDIVAPLELP